MNVSRANIDANMGLVPHSVSLEVDPQQPRLEFVYEDGERLLVVLCTCSARCRPSSSSSSLHRWDPREDFFEWKVLKVLVTFQPNKEDPHIRWRTGEAARQLPVKLTWTSSGTAIWWMVNIICKRWINGCFQSKFKVQSVYFVPILTGLHGNVVVK